MLTGVAHASIVHQNIYLALLVDDSLYGCLYALVIRDVQCELMDVGLREAFQGFGPASGRVHNASLRSERFASAKRAKAK